MVAFVSANVDVRGNRARMLERSNARHCPRRKSGPYALWAARSRSSHLIDRDIDNNGAASCANYLSVNALRRGAPGMSTRHQKIGTSAESSIVCASSISVDTVTIDRSNAADARGSCR